MSGGVGAGQSGVTGDGAGAADVVGGPAEEDHLGGLGGKDSLATGAGYDGINGGAGFDVLQLNGSLSDYTAEASGEGYLVTGTDGTDFLVGVEQLEFTDGTTIAVSDLAGAQPTPDPGPAPEYSSLSDASENA